MATFRLMFGFLSVAELKCQLDKEIVLKSYFMHKFFPLSRARVAFRVSARVV